MSLLTIGTDMIQEILIRLPVPDLREISATSNAFCKITQTEYFWQQKYQFDHHLFVDTIPDLVSEFYSPRWKEIYIDRCNQINEIRKRYKCFEHQREHIYNKPFTYEPINVPESVRQLFLTLETSTRDKRIPH